jgi:hypothetical protein
MFDDLRNSPEVEVSFTPEEEVDLDIDLLLKKKQTRSAIGIRIDSRTFLGMNAFQRFVISTLLFGMVFVLGIMLLMVTGKIALPF